MCAVSHTYTKVEMGGKSDRWHSSDHLVFEIQHSSETAIPFSILHPEFISVTHSHTYNHIHQIRWSLSEPFT